jgi:hypothetical protein
LQEDEKQNCEKIYWNLWSTFWITELDNGDSFRHFVTLPN